MSSFASMNALVLTVIAVAFFTLLVTIIGLKVGAKWLSRGAHGGGMDGGGSKDYSGDGSTW